MYRVNRRQLPFADSSFDAVLNIESSFRYPSIEHFFAEVRRVLQRQGYFLYPTSVWPMRLKSSTERSRAAD